MFLRTLALFLIAAMTACSCLAADAPSLSHADAQKILESMYQNVSVGAVVMSKSGGAKVIAIATRNNAAVKLERDFFYDAELGWFLYEYDDDGQKPPAKLRIGSLSGCRELKPVPNLLAKDSDDVEKLRNDLTKAMDLEDYARAIAVLDKLSKAQPMMNFIYGPKKFKMLLTIKNMTAAYDLANELLVTFKDEPVPLNSIASALVDPENPVENPDLALAEKAALRAKELMSGKKADDQLGRILDTLARIHAAKGDYAKAIEFETSAIEITKLESARIKLEIQLQVFKSAKPKVDLPK